MKSSLLLMGGSLLGGYLYGRSAGSKKCKEGNKKLRTQRNVLLLSSLALGGMLYVSKKEKPLP